LVTVFAALNILIFMGTGFSQGREPSNDREARNVLERTNAVLVDAQGAVRRHKVYTGDLAAAYSHEDYARQLYRQNQFHSAIEHSLYARRLAYQTLEANNVRYKREVYRDELRLDSRRSDALNQEVRRGHPDGPRDDRSAATLTFDLHF
jgi:hypothetical protein